MSKDIIPIPFKGTEVLTIDVDGKPHVILKPFIESLGITYAAQYRKLSGRSWASVAQRAMQVPGDTQVRTVTLVDVRTALMLLATINENNVPADKRDLLVAYQSEVADVIESYWTKGGVINPRADEEQLADIAEAATSQMQVLSLARGLIDADWLAAKAKIVASRALGESPQISADEMPLYVDNFLKEKGLSSAQVKALRSPFGRRVSQAHFDFYGYRPAKAPAEVNGRPREVNAYTGRDRHLFDRAWSDHFAAIFDADVLEVAQ